MTLRQKQSKFIHMTALLILHGEQLGYEFTGGVFYIPPKYKYGHRRSLHKKKLAWNLNVFKDGKYLRGKAVRLAHKQLHAYWDIIGGAERIEKDLNHYSLEWGGMR